MEVAIIVIVVFVVLLLVVIAIVRLCNKYNCCGCCDNDTESLEDIAEGHDDSESMEEEGGHEEILNEPDLEELDDDEEDELHGADYLCEQQVVVDMDGEEYVVNKMEESLL